MVPGREIVEQKRERRCSECVIERLKFSRRPRSARRMGISANQLRHRLLVVRSNTAANAAKHARRGSIIGIWEASGKRSTPRRPFDRAAVATTDTTDTTGEMPRRGVFARASISLSTSTKYACARRRARTRQAGSAQSRTRPERRGGQNHVADHPLERRPRACSKKTRTIKNFWRTPKSRRGADDE